MTFRETSQLLLNRYEKFMYLKLYVEDNNRNLYDKYKTHIKNHNSKLRGSDVNRVFELLSPGDPNHPDFQITAYPGKINILDYKIKCKAYIIKNFFNYSCAFYINSHSNLIKTSMRLATNYIINPSLDNIKLGFDIIPKMKIGDQYIAKEYVGNLYDIYVQISGPELCPIYVDLVDNIEDLELETNKLYRINIEEFYECT